MFGCARLLTPIISRTRFLKQHLRGFRRPTRTRNTATVSLACQTMSTFACEIAVRGPAVVGSDCGSIGRRPLLGSRGRHNGWILSLLTAAQQNSMELRLL